MALSLPQKQRRNVLRARFPHKLSELQHTSLYYTHLEGTDLTRALLEGKRLQPDDLERIHKWDESLPRILPPVDLRRASFDSSTNLEGIILGSENFGFIMLADTLWNGVNLAVVKWSEVKMLGDERQAKGIEGKEKDLGRQLEEHEIAARANRQIAVALQAQGITEDASRFAYRAHRLQRIVYLRRRKFGQYLFSGFLDLIAGYGHKPGRSVIWYLVMIFGFTLAYFTFGHLPFFPDAFVFSLTSFHGRGFFPGLGSENSLHNPLVVIAAFEAVIGLLIEISFIATFTQRFFGR